MPVRRYQAQRQVDPQLWVVRPLPIDNPCAIYARQSTAKQVVDNLESAAMQTTEQINKARAMGWGEGEANKVYLFVENQQKDGTIRRASGTLRIDEREGLSALMELIYRDVIKAILVYNESRLFRDEWQIQVDTFIKACYDHDVLVITNTYQYDFRRNPHAADTFRMQAKIAADYIKNHVKGLLHPAIERIALRGEYVRGGVPVGFIVDYQKKSDTYRKFVIYEPHARIVRYLFRRYRELKGNLSALGRELHQYPFVFPDFVGVLPSKHFMLKRVNGGYTISRNGLTWLLTNVAYIGHWSVKGVIVRKHNHDAIIDEDDFFYAYNRLSSVTIDGEEQERLETLPTRYNHVDTVPCEALLRDVIESDNGKPVYVGNKQGVYRIYDNVNAFTRIISSFSVKGLDNIYEARLIWRLKSEHQAGTQDTPDALYARLREVQASREKQSSSIETQLEQANSRMAVLRRNLDLDADTETLQGWAKELKGLALVKEALERKIDSTEKSKEKAAKLATLYERVKADWNGLSFDQKRDFVNMATKRVKLIELSSHIFKLEIVWDEPYNEVDTAFIWDTLGNQEHWTDEEKATIEEMYATADRAAILQRLPKRSWRSIAAYAHRRGLERSRHNVNTSTVNEYLSLEDAEIIQREDIVFDTGWRRNKATWLEPCPIIASDTVVNEQAPSCHQV